MPRTVAEVDAVVVSIASCGSQKCATIACHALSVLYDACTVTQRSAVRCTITATIRVTTIDKTQVRCSSKPHSHSAKSLTPATESVTGVEVPLAHSRILAHLN